MRISPSRLAGVYPITVLYVLAVGIVFLALGISQVIG